MNENKISTGDKSLIVGLLIVALLCFAAEIQTLHNDNQTSGALFGFMAVIAALTAAYWSAHKLTTAQ